MIVDLRHRIELIAVRLVERALPSLEHAVDQNHIARRLAFLPVVCERQASVTELLGMVRIARHIYRRSSDVLHGRSSMVNFPRVLIDEWSEAIGQIEQILKR